jgi:hypothetical protein
MTIETAARSSDERVLWRKSMPFFMVHLAPLGLIWWVCDLATSS